MDDQFLRDLKAQPNPEFAARLRATLRAVPPNAVARVAPAANMRKWFAAAASIAVVSFAFTLPTVQAAAEAFLDLFRVKQFTGVQFDPQRLEALGSSGISPEAIFGNVEPLTDFELQPVSYASPAEAGQAAGIRVRTPVWLPIGYSGTAIMVSAEHAARITVNTAGLQAVLDTLGLADVDLPEGLDGQTATVRVPPIVTQSYRLASARHVARRGVPNVGHDRLALDADRAGAVEGRRLSPDQCFRARGPLDRGPRAEREVPGRGAHVVGRPRDLRSRRSRQR